MDYTRVLKGAFEIAWRHKAIWLFAFIATVFGAGDGSPRFRYSLGYRFPADEALPQPFSDILSSPLVRSFLENPVPFFAAFSALALVFWLVGTIARSFARGAMIAMVDEVERSGATSIQSGARGGTRTLAPVVGVSLLLAIPSAVILLGIVALAMPVFYPLVKDVLSSLAAQQGFPQPPSAESQYPGFEALSALFPALFCLLCVGWLIGLVTTTLEKLSIRSCVLESLGVLGSIRRGWTVGLKNIGYVIITLILFAILMFVVSLVVAIPMMALSFASLMSLVRDPQHAMNWSVILTGAACGLVISAVIGTLLSSLVETTWTMLYMAGASHSSA